ncbi:putative secreted protein with PEP-CTERM sorting signal [Balneicella halophila]|uniref:Putative secreted protein with PEP-CTERM sorting signal n=1 Tax=Balneicella halophila TaxID=1537566 RepID=A0A7L4UPW6_BALHA|nr:DUF3185 family protein [Balneicella halophila]PVX49400.1 putative secreted protein with PEP-CTERM sorting signal [Balneicella halophila]
MNISKVIGIILIVVGIILAYYGVTTISENNHAIELFGAELDFSNESGKEQGYIYLGLALVAFIAGVFMVRKKK